jgi:LuxR family transcriptional regulator, maltose regulon positive regulatory protein
MTANRTISAKITRPASSGAVRRERLFALLDRKAEKPVIWIAAPAGYGKTTLVSSWLDFREIPCIWYYCDEADSDPATFFYYMGIAAKKAAPRRSSPLPLLTPEYLPGIVTFARSFFETLCERLASSLTPTPSRKGITSVIVLDNYQDISAESPFHEIMDKGFAVAGSGVRIVVISRDRPPPAFTRMQASGRMSLITGNDVMFTLEESRELVRGLDPGLGDERINAMHAMTKGWAAGMILMLERGRLRGDGAKTAADFDYGGVFDYFAEVLFGKTAKHVQDFLLKTALLPMVSVPLAETLTGIPDAGTILATFNSRHFFTEKLGDNGRDYQYHPLFRDFLLNMAKTVFPAGQLAAIRKEAGALLEQTGRMEDAARLYGDAGDRDGLIRMVINHGRELLAQGRNKTLEEWIASIPGGVDNGNPWLLYWTGMCSFPTDMARARDNFERAFESFRTGNDTRGVYLSWSGIVDTHVFGLDEWKCLDGCIAVFEELRKTHTSFPSREIELIVSSRMLISLTLRKTDRPHRVHSWLQRVSSLLQENPAFDIQMDTMFCMSVYYLWKGDYDRNAVLLERAEAEIRHRKPSPFVMIRVKSMKGIHFWITAGYGAALATLAEGLAISGKSGVHVFDSLLWGFRAAAEMASGAMAAAKKSLESQMSSLLDMSNTLDVFFYHVNSAWYALLTGNPALAAEHLQTVAANTARMGTPYYRALWSIGMAQVLLPLGRAKEAKAHLQAAHRISLTMKSSVMEWYSLMIEAWFLLLEDRKTEALHSLRPGLMLGKKHGYVHLEFYQPEVMSVLCATALEEGIETGYVKKLIRKLNLTPPNLLASSPLLPPDGETTAGIMYPEKWPYPVKIYTLGRFEILRNDESLFFPGKEQKKPLEMLKVLIAFGGRDVPEEQLTDALWPEADGDLAHKSFEMALARLRRLLGGDIFIRHRARQLTVNPLYCWVDSLALDNLLSAGRTESTNEAIRVSEKALPLYAGPFLRAETAMPCVVARRETLKNKVLRMILAAGRRHEQSGAWELAADYYMKGIETDSLAEELHRRLMICQIRLGNHGEATKTYRRCQDTLKAELGIAPSPETTAIYTAIVQRQ